MIDGIDDSCGFSSPSSGGTSLEGYVYQLDVSVWMPCIYSLQKRVAQRLVLEPATEDDLETDIDGEPGALAQEVDLAAYRLVTQCKLR
jgi:hypothetical protein